MKTIIPVSERADKLLGPQRVKPSISCRESDFLVRTTCEDGTLIFHTLTGELRLLDPGEDLAETEELIRARYYVPVELDERKQVRDMRNVARLLKPGKHVTGFEIATTTDCNAHCFYCFELGCRRFPMSPETARETAAHIARVSGGEKVKINWFGGEPLYNRAAIEIITSDLRQRGITFSSTMTTNGYFLDEETARTAVEAWNVKSVQITLDGTREVYNRVKAYADAVEDPFSRVLDNIGHAVDAGIMVSVRLNVGRDNAEDLRLLAEQLASRFPKRDRLHVYAALLEDFSDSAQPSISEAEKEEIGVSLVKKLYQLGLGSLKLFSNEPKLSRCMADDDASEAIMPDGRIAKCDQFEEEDIVGSIYGDQYDHAAIRTWKQAEETPACASCPLYPRCVNLKRCPWTKGGCSESARAMKLRRLELELLAAYRKVKAEKITEEQP